MSHNMNSDKERISELEKKADELQQQQKLGDTLNVLEEVLNLKREVYGEDSEQYQKTSEKLCEICNIIAMICLNKDKNDSCYDFLKKAEILCQGSALYKAITYNNMAQYCKKTNKIKTGIQYLQKAQEIQLKQGNPVLLADTHLNLCALLSRVERHQEALEHILIAVVLLQDEYSNILLKKISQGYKNGTNNDSSAASNTNSQTNQEEQQQEEANSDLFSKLSIAYHNMGVEFEFLKRYDESLQTYEKAVNFARVNLGPQHELVKQFDQVFQQAQQSIADNRHKEIMRKKPANLKLTQVSTVYNHSQEKYFPQSTKNGTTAQNSRQASSNLYNMGPKQGSSTQYSNLNNLSTKNKRQTHTSDGFVNRHLNKNTSSSTQALPQIVQPKSQQQNIHKESHNPSNENKQVHSNHPSDPNYGQNSKENEKEQNKNKELHQNNQKNNEQSSHTKLSEKDIGAQSNQEIK